MIDAKKSKWLWLKNKSRFPRRRKDMKLVIKNRAVFNYGNHWSIESGKRRGFEKLKVKKVKTKKVWDSK